VANLTLPKLSFRGRNFDSGSPTHLHSENEVRFVIEKLQRDVLFRVS
jgi:hypothetical protein